MGRVIFLFMASLVSAQAVLFYSTAEPTFNTTPPTGDLAGSGWAFEGTWGAFLGTPIAPRFFITAKHIGGAEGELFTFAGTAYSTAAFYDDPSTDLRIWRIQGSFPFFAPLYLKQDEVGRQLVVIGRGTQRGDPVILTNQQNSSVKGWKWGKSDGVQRWGQSTVDTVVTNVPIDRSELLQVLFQAGSVTNETDLSGGDSGGALFINDGSSWKLAGINYAVTGPYNTTNTGSGFQAALFDQGGLYAQDDTKWVYQAETPSTNQPGAFYATRISVRQGWINQVLSESVLPNGPSLIWSAKVTGPYAPDKTASINIDSKTITVPNPPSSRYYQIYGNVAWKLQSVQENGDHLVLTYGRSELNTSSLVGAGGLPPGAGRDR
jgi:hypothetical protein